MGLTTSLFMILLILYVIPLKILSLYSTVMNCLHTNDVGFLKAKFFSNCTRYQNDKCVKFVTNGLYQDDLVVVAFLLFLTT